MPITFLSRTYVPAVAIVGYPKYPKNAWIRDLFLPESARKPMFSHRKIIHARCAEFTSRGYRTEYCEPDAYAVCECTRLNVATYASLITQQHGPIYDLASGCSEINQYHMAIGLRIGRGACLRTVEIIGTAAWNRVRNRQSTLCFHRCRQP